MCVLYLEWQKAPPSSFWTKWRIREKNNFFLLFEGGVLGAETFSSFNQEEKVSAPKKKSPTAVLSGVIKF